MSKRKKNFKVSGSEMLKYLGNPFLMKCPLIVGSRFFFVRDSGGWLQSTTKQNIEFSLSHGIHKTYIEGWWKGTCENAKFLQCTWRTWYHSLARCTWYHSYHRNVISWPSRLMASHSIHLPGSTPAFYLLTVGELMGPVTWSHHWSIPIQ